MTVVFDIAPFLIGGSGITGVSVAPENLITSKFSFEREDFERERGWRQLLRGWLERLESVKKGWNNSKLQSAFELQISQLSSLFISNVKSVSDTGLCWRARRASACTSCRFVSDYNLSSSHRLPFYSILTSHSSVTSHSIIICHSILTSRHLSSASIPAVWPNFQAGAT